MKKAVITGEKRAEIVDVPDPVAREDWVVVKVHVAPMCTEYKTWLQGTPTDNLGHEAVGEVVGIGEGPGGPGPGRWSEGDRVVVMPLTACGKCELCIAGDFIYCASRPDFAEFTGGGEGSATYAQYLLKPAHLLAPIPEGVSYETAALTLCALGPSFGAFDRMGVSAFDTVLVTGLGPVGMGAVVNAAFRGARVIGVDSIAWRAEKARALGADAVVDPTGDDPLGEIKALTGGRGVDAALDCAGVAAAERLCMDAARTRGQVAFVGECYAEQLVVTVSPDLIRTGLTVHGSWHYNMNLYPKVLKVATESPVAKDLISHRMPLAQVQKAFEVSAGPEHVKMLLKPWE